MFCLSVSAIFAADGHRPQHVVALPTDLLPLLPAAAKVKVAAELGGQFPEILGVHRVYIQTRAQSRVTLTVGGRAYLWPNTSVVIRCPVRRFQKPWIRWTKDGHCLQTSPRWTVTSSGSLKLLHLAAPDIGTYHCVAGSAHKSLVLKLIGSNNRLLLPPVIREQSKDSPGLDHEADCLGATLHKMQKLKASRKKRGPGEGQVAWQPSLVMLLGPCVGISGSQEQQLEAAARLGACSMDIAQFEELIRNISQFMGPGEAGDDVASQLIYQLVAHLTAVPTASLPPQPEEEVPPVSRVPHGGTCRLALQLQAPTLLRPSQAPSVSLNQTVSMRIGAAVYITPRTTVVNILCELLTPTEATFSWTKDGVPIQPSNR